MRWLKGLFFIGGMGLLAYAFAAVDATSVLSDLFRIRWWFALALLSTFGAIILRTVAWSLIIGERAGAVSFAKLWRIRLIGEAFSFLTFAGPFLGDPTKAYLIWRETGTKQAATSVAVDRYLYSVSVALFFVIVAAFWLPPSRVVILLALAVAIGLSPIWIARFSPQLRRPAMYAVVAIHLISHGFMVLEVAVILRALDVLSTLPLAFIVEAMTKGMHAVFFFVPLQVGVFEGGHAMLLHYFKVSAALGLTLGIARRVRSLFWSALGLAMLWRLRLRHQIGGDLVLSGHPSEQFSK